MKAPLSFMFLLSFIFSAYAQESNPNVKKWTLRDCVNYALENNITVKQSENNIALAEVDKRGAIGNFIPNLNMSSSAAWNSGLTTDVTTGVLINQTTQTTNGGISSGVAIYRGLRNQNELRRAELSILASQYQLDKIKDDVSLFVINAYLEALFSKEAVNVAIPQVEISKEQLARTKQLVEAGTLPRGDLLDVEATLANDEQNLIVTQNRVQLALIALAQLLQLEDYENFDIANEEIETLPLINLADYSVDKIYAKALETRNEIKVAKTNIEIAEKDIKLAKGALQPTLSGFFNWNSRYSNRDIITGSEIDPDNPTRVIGVVETTGDNVVAPNFTPVTGPPLDFFDQFDQNKGSSFGLSLQIPIFNGFNASNNVRRAEINYDQQKYQLEQEELDLERIIHQVYADAVGALKLYEATKRSLEAREISFNYAQERFDVGVLNSFDYSQIKNRLVTANADFLTAKYDFIFRVKLLEFYYGIPVENL
ncbi:TolC family protein [Lutimonas zeaxanthinifaciens]|uniref:TolC family protein n=1 Tax=Lutimonas zeaxanthinifaciens TaxID=3060215 RepID=UPI00265CF174|nr:TolC family protein [Lutimonas sp. YSD2104]WKK66366.1 TolC family protein [Lutimonas sp. YSD2104]